MEAKGDFLYNSIILTVSVNTEQWIYLVHSASLEDSHVEPKKRPGDPGHLRNLHHFAKEMRMKSQSGVRRP